jgi:hypothetical protein
VVFKGVTDVAGNGSSDAAASAGDLSVTVPAQVLASPSIVQMGTVTSDNVINLAERSTSQSISIGVKGAQANDVLRLYMDGVLVGTKTLSSAEAVANTVSLDLAANAWGADGERVLSSSIQRGSEPVHSAPANRHVYVAADQAHWSAASTNGVGNVLWFDPETLAVNVRVGQGSAASAGTNDYLANVGGARAYATSANAQPLAVISANGRIMLSMDGGDALRMTVPTATLPSSNHSFYYVAVGQSLTNAGGFRWLGAMGINSFTEPQGIVVGQVGSSIYTGFFGSTYMTPLNAVSAFVNQSIGYLGIQGCVAC